MKNLLPWALLFLTSIAQAKNVLLIGDSHSVGPYGQKLFELLRNDGHNVALFAHSSSAPLHWTADTPSKLTGGVLHKLSVEGKLYLHPNPTHWREKVETIPFAPLLQNMLYHQEWKQKVDILVPDYVVVSLGANDYFSLTNERGEYQRENFLRRQKAIISLLEGVKDCTWVFPPKMKKNHEERYQKLYKFLEESIQNRCEIVYSQEFQATGCDGVHFSCASELYKGHAWAKKVFLKLKEIL